MSALSLLALAALTGCRNDISLQEVKSRIAVSSELIDVGEIPLGETHDFTLGLLGVRGGEVAIRSVEVTNTQGDYFEHDGELTVVPAFGSSALGFSYTPLALGYHQARVTIVSDALEQPTFVVTLRGRARTPRATITPSLLDFGPVEAGTTVEAEVTLHNDAQLPFEIGLESLNGPFALVSATPIALLGGQSTQLSLSFSPTDTSFASGLARFGTENVVLAELDLMGNACAEGQPALYDLDGDGVTSCAGDCDDGDAAVRPGAPESFDGLDNDCDGAVDEGTEAYDDDGDGFAELDGDCNDGAPSVGPDMEETLGNGVDDDCDGVIDSGSTDGDGDGVSPAGGDCDDGDPAVRPGAAELANGRDDDCDGTVDEGTAAWDDDGDGFCEHPSACIQPGVSPGDCDDTSARGADRWPGADEAANGLDDDCDGEVDEGTEASDDDGDGYSERGGDCDDTNPAIRPGGREIPANGVDEDCNGRDG
jgi:hypothetical protein